MKIFISLLLASNLMSLPEPINKGYVPESNTIRYSYDLNNNGRVDYIEDYALGIEYDGEVKLIKNKYPIIYRFDLNQDGMFDIFETLIDINQDGLNGNEELLANRLYPIKKERKYEI